MTVQCSESASKDQPGENRGTLIVDAIFAPQNIRFPQDVNIGEFVYPEENIQATVVSLGFEVVTLGLSIVFKDVRHERVEYHKEIFVIYNSISDAGRYYF